ncbi:MAG: CRISPR-associated endonuclease Cas1 [Nitrospirae bacterium]|nr:MAG: CRISPR-associated endonuclease Cas1 [Nitrospirota bacterium]
MAVVYIDRKGCLLKRDGNTIALYSDGKKQGTIPLGPVERIIVVGNCTVETSLLRYVTARGAVVAFLSARGRAMPAIVTSRQNFNGALRVLQYKRSLQEDFIIKFCTQLVHKKISGQMILLKELGQTHSTSILHLKDTLAQMEGILSKVREGESLESLRGLEGSAGRLYFTELARLLPQELGFRGRTRRPPKDPVNAMLSFSYSLFYTEIVTALLIAGLEPTIGFYHCFDYGRDSLACDIEEVFRPDIDRFVCKLFLEKCFSRKDFIQEKGGVYLKKSARARFYPLYEENMTPIRTAMRDFIRTLIEEIKDEEKPLHCTQKGSED